MKLQDLSEEYQKLQNDLNDNIQRLQKLESQRQENKSVKLEIDKLPEDANVYKLVGPVLLKQDKFDVDTTVDGRIQFIEGQIQDVERFISEAKEKTEKKRMEIFQLQSQVEQSA